MPRCWMFTRRNKTPAPTYKHGYGFHPLGAWCDTTGEPLALMLGSGNAGSNDADDHLELLDQPIGALPEEYHLGHEPGDDPDLVRHHILVRADSAGATHDFVSGMAVGGNSKGFLAEAWNGAQWATQSAPKPKDLPREDIFMADVSCPSSACSADGFYINGKGNKDTAAEAWNGTRWVVHATLNPSIGMNGVTSSLLAAVSCSSPKACTAVGGDENDKGA